MSSADRPIVVVPDGLAARGRPPVTVPEPGFVFRAVLDHVAERYRDRTILLAPANDFGCGTTEQEVARLYLEERGLSRLEAPESPPIGYIDTRGNASVLRDDLAQQGRWPLGPITLVTAESHAARARLCFRREAYEIAELDAVGFTRPRDELLPPRLWFHHYGWTHRLYELGAITRDAFRPARR